VAWGGNVWSHLRHRYPGIRGKVHNCRGHPGWPDGHRLEGEDLDNSPAGETMSEIAEVRQKKKIASGEIFLTRNGKGLSRWQTWAEMKAICKKADVAPSKVFPHNLRHLFARTFYRACRDVVKLADVLGHSSIETARIYLISTGVEHARQLERLQLVS